VISLGVVAHTSRATQARELARCVRADYLSVDDGSLNCDDNHEHVQHHLAGLPATWAIIVEDDALPVPGFREQAEAALPMAPSPIVSFYLGRMRPPWAQAGIQSAIEAADTENADWIVGTHLLHGVAYAIRTELLPSVMHYPTPLPVDQHISRWAQAHGHLISYTWPSLVDHADGPTVVQHPDGQPREPGRVAWKTSPHDSWSTRSVTLRIECSPPNSSPNI
jgi:hypothetical protein